jgi:DNA polymerase-3 subunit delta
MIIFVHGENSYLSLKHVEKMRVKFSATLDKSGMNLAEFPLSGKKIEIGAVMQSVQTPPFLGEKRMVIVKGLLEDVTTKPNAQPWVDALQKTPDTTIVILLNSLPASKVQKNHLFKSLSGQDGVHVYDFPALQGSALTAWAADYAKELGLSIDRTLLSELIGLVGADLWQLSGELSKIAAYADGKPATQVMISELVRANYEDAMFDFVDAVSQKNSVRALDLLHAQRESGSSDFHLFAMLARQIRLLLGARTVLDANPNAGKAEVASEMGIHPFVAQKTLAQAKSFDTPSLVLLHGMLESFDQKMKSGGIAADVAVDRLVVKMLK